MLLKNPGNFKDLNGDDIARVKRQMAKSIVLHLYRLCTTKESPRLMKALNFLMESYGNKRLLSRETVGTRIFSN